MHPTAIGIVVFLCSFGGALAGMRLRGLLPERHLEQDARDTVKVGIGLIATMTALVLGLVTASAKNAFDAQDLVLELDGPFDGLIAVSQDPMNLALARLNQ
jgi:hypothetical protein